MITKSRPKGHRTTGRRDGDVTPHTRVDGLPSAADDIIGGLQEIIAMKKAGIDPATSHPSRTYVIPEPTAWTPDRVRELRARFGIAQAAFAKLLGVSTILAQGWEQGKRTPAPLAARLLDTVSANPAAWLVAIGAEVPGFGFHLTAALPATGFVSTSRKRPPTTKVEGTIKLRALPASKVDATDRASRRRA